MTDPGPELDPEIGMLLDAERLRPDVGAEVQARLLARVSGGLVVAGVAGGAAAVAAKGATKPWLGLVSAFVVGGLVGALVTWSMRPPPVERTVTVEKRIEVPVPVTVVVPAPQPPAPSTSLAVLPTVAAKPTSSVGSAAEEEVAIQQIHSALGRGDTAAALAAAAAHEKRFPNGQQADAREALAVQALVRAGRREEADTRATRFKKRFPGSFYQSIVDQALANPK